jgi:integrase/recombinase XerC
MTTTTEALEEYVERYLAYCEQRDKSPRTLRTYKYVLDSYVRAFEGRQAATLTLQEVEAWVGRKRRSPVSNITLRKDAVIVRGLHQWLIERGIPMNPLTTLRFGQQKRAVPKPVDDDVWRRVWMSDLDTLDRVWLGLGYFAGLRRLEIIQLRANEWLGAELNFERKGGFHANVEHQACFDWVDRALPHLTCGIDWPALLRAHCEHRLEVGATYVWPDTSDDGSERDCNRLNKRCDTLTKSLGIPAGALTPHRLRHSCATNLLRADVPIGIIQRQLAHSSIDITQRYLQMSGELARAYHGAANQRARE